MKEEAAIKQPCSSMALKWAELKQHYFTDDCVRRRDGSGEEPASMQLPVAMRRLRGNILRS